MLRCREVTHIVASGEVERLGWRQRMQLRLHLMMCVHCRRYLDQLATIGRLARRVWGPQSTDPGRLARLERRVLAAVHDACHGDHFPEDDS